MQVGELVRVKDTGHLGVVIKVTSTFGTAKVHWIYPKWTLPQSWVHHNRLEVLCG